MRKSPSIDSKEILEGKMFAILSYLFILCIIPLLFKKDNRFVLDHGKQGLVIFVGEVAAFVIHTVPFLRWVWGLTIPMFGILSLIGIIAVLRGQYIRFPIISEVADKITL